MCTARRNLDYSSSRVREICLAVKRLYSNNSRGYSLVWPCAWLGTSQNPFGKMGMPTQELFLGPHRSETPTDNSSRFRVLYSRFGETGLRVRAVGGAKWGCRLIKNNQSEGNKDLQLLPVWPGSRPQRVHVAQFRVQGVSLPRGCQVGFQAREVLVSVSSLSLGMNIHEPRRNGGWQKMKQKGEPRRTKEGKPLEEVGAAPQWCVDHNPLRLRAKHRLQRLGTQVSRLPRFVGELRVRCAWSCAYVCRHVV